MIHPKVLNKYKTQFFILRIQLYLDWFQSLILIHYFQQHFDTKNLLSRNAYTTIAGQCTSKILDKKQSGLFSNHFEKVFLFPL